MYMDFSWILFICVCSVFHSEILLDHKLIESNFDDIEILSCFFVVAVLIYYVALLEA